MRKNIIRVTLGRTSRVFFPPLSKREQFCFSRRGKKGVYVGTFTDPFPFSWGRKEGKDKHVLFSATTPFLARHGWSSGTAASPEAQSAKPTHPFDPSPSTRRG